MYEAVFGLEQRPFDAAVRTERFFPTEASQQALDSLSRAIKRGAGPGLLIAAAGTGKTLMLHLLAEQFQDRFEVAMLTGARLESRKALLQNLLFELGLPYRGLEEGELRLALIDHLEPSDSCPNGMLLLIDEAHTLPLRLLEEIRLITNLVRDGQPRVRLVLAGGSQLEERFTNPKLESFNQRIVARCYLHSLSRDETFQYVRHQISSLGGDGDVIFSDDALAAVYTATDGIPRLINQLCDHAMMLASLGGHDRLDASGIEEAWADLQQLPIPYQSDEISTEGDAGVLEFGTLDDEAGDRQASPVVAVDPESQIERIERQIVAFSDESLPENPPMHKEETGREQAFAPGGKPEVELVFHGPHNPFGGKFEEEEVVIDRYASLEAEIPPSRPRVTGPESHELAAALNAHPRVPETTETTNESVDNMQQDYRVEEEPGSATFDPASDPVMPESAAVNRSAIDVDQPIDDRDMIVIVDQESPADDTPAPAKGQAQRRQYRQLFSQMRGE